MLRRPSVTLSARVHKDDFKVVEEVTTEEAVAYLLLTDYAVDAALDHFQSDWAWERQAA